MHLFQHVQAVLTVTAVLLGSLSARSDAFYNYPRPCVNVPPYPHSMKVQSWASNGSLFGAYPLPSGNFVFRGDGAIGGLHGTSGTVMWKFTPTWFAEVYLGPYVLGRTIEGDPVSFYAPYNVPSNIPLTLTVHGSETGDLKVNHSFPLVNRSPRFTTFGVSADASVAMALVGDKLTVVNITTGIATTIDASGIVTPTTQLSWPMQIFPLGAGQYRVIWVKSAHMALHGSVVDVAAQTIRSVWSGVSSLPSAGLNFQFSKNGGTLFAVGFLSYSPAQCWYMAIDSSSGSVNWKKIMSNAAGSCDQLVQDPTTSYLLVTPTAMALTALSPSDGSVVWNASVAPYQQQWSRSFGPEADVFPSCHINGAGTTSIIYSPGINDVGAIHPFVVYVLEPYGGSLDTWWVPPRHYNVSSVYYKHVTPNSGGVGVFSSASEPVDIVQSFFVPFRQFCGGQPSSGEYCSGESEKRNV